MSECQDVAVLEKPEVEVNPEPMSDDTIVQSWAFFDGPQEVRKFTCKNVYGRNYRVNWYGPGFCDPIIKSLFVSVQGEGDDKRVCIHKDQ